MSDEQNPDQPGEINKTPKEDGLNKDDAAATGPTPEEQEHARRMADLFGDLDDDGDEPETLADVQADRDDMRAQVERLKASVARTRKENSLLMQKVNEGKDKITAVENLRAQDRKEITVEFLTDMLPVAKTLQEGLKEIDADERAANPKLDKLTQGVENTMSQLTAVFNKYGIKEGQKPAPKAPAASTTPAETTPETVTPDATTPDATPAPDAVPPAPPEIAETIESVKAELNALMSEAGQLSTTVSKAQSDNLLLTRRIEEGKQLLQREEAKREDERAYGVEKPLKELMPVIDTLELGLKLINKKAREEDANFDLLAKAVEGALGNVTEVFNKYGIQQINPIDQPFDAEKHEAITLAVVPGKDPETVVQVAQKGYSLKDRNVRHAKVVVTPPE